MAKTMRVILLEDITEIGRAGDIVVVSEGYARNFLFPQSKAALATENIQRDHNRRAKNAEKEKQEKIKALQEKAEQLDGTELVVIVRVKEGSDEIFGRITANTLALRLKEQGKVACKARDIKLKKNITEVGEYDVLVDLGAGVETTIHIRIVPEEDKNKTKPKNK